MKLYEHFGKDGFHTSVATSFNVDFDAYENVMLARFRGAGCHNNLLIADGAMLSFALDGASALPRYAGRSYSVVGAKADAVFHPKIVLQLGREGGRMFVSSANVTSPGLAGNLEIAGLLESDGSDNGEARLIAGAWEFLQRFLGPKDEGVRHQIDWMRARTPWLRHITPATEIVKLADGSAAGFFTTGRATGIAEQFLQAFRGEAVRRLVIVSPYWDENLEALRYIRNRTGAHKAHVLVDSSRGLFPAHAVGDAQDIEIREFKRGSEKRFVHAKLIIVQTDRFDHILYGSANCTTPALGNARFRGANEEACLYRALPAGAAIEVLELADVLASAPLHIGALPPFAPGEPIPLGELAKAHPGHFECRFDTVAWWPPFGASADSVVVELLNTDGDVMPFTLVETPLQQDGARRWRLIGCEGRPSFARTRSQHGNVSALAIILLLDVLREEVKDRRNRRVDVLIAQLDEETDVGLWLLEALNSIEAEELTQRQRMERAPRRTAKGHDSADETAEAARTLTYAQFVAGRRLRSTNKAVSRNSLAGSELSHVRGFLNRLLSIGEPAPELAEAAVVGDAFNMGDEVADGASALEGGDNFNPPRQKPVNGDRTQTKQLNLARARHRRANRDALVAVVPNLSDLVLEKTNDTGINKIDLLRLRVVIMMLANAGWDGRSAPSLAQVLPPAGDKEGSWPRLIGRVLSIYFGGSNPAVSTLPMEEYYDQLTDDILESWATCLWAVHAIMISGAENKEVELLLRNFERLRKTIYQVTGLRPVEFSDPRIIQTMEALNQRFGENLRLDGGEILMRHAKSAQALSSTA